MKHHWMTIGLFVDSYAKAAESIFNCHWTFVEVSSDVHRIIIPWFMNCHCKVSETIFIAWGEIGPVGPAGPNRDGGPALKAIVKHWVALDCIALLLDFVIDSAFYYLQIINDKNWKTLKHIGRHCIAWNCIGTKRAKQGRRVHRDRIGTGGPAAKSIGLHRIALSYDWMIIGKHWEIMKNVEKHCISLKCVELHWAIARPNVSIYNR